MVFLFTDLLPLHSISMYQPLQSRGNLVMLFKGCRRFVRTACRVSIPGASLGNESKAPPRFLRDKKIVPDADPPHMEDIHKLYRLFEQRSIFFLHQGFQQWAYKICKSNGFPLLFYSWRLTVLTGAGVSTECGIPDYRRLSFDQDLWFPCSLSLHLVPFGNDFWGVILFCCSPNGAYSSGFKPITHQVILKQDLWNLYDSQCKLWIILLLY